MPFIVVVLLIIVSSCMFIPHNSNPSWWWSKKPPRLPNLYDQDYGSIKYKCRYTEQRSMINKLWAQEAIGTPEAREFIKALQGDGFKFSPAQLGIVDTGFYVRRKGHPRFSSRLNRNAYYAYLNSDTTLRSANLHGTNTLGLIAGKEPVGVSSLGEVDKLYETKGKPELIFNSFAAYLAEGKEIPELINASIGYTHHDLKTLPSGGKKFIETSPVNGEQLSNAKQVLAKTIWVNAAGNEQHISSSFIEEIGDRMILVGSADPGGFPSKFSSTSENVVVLAPSDKYISSINHWGRIVKFGGTSGAAPMVTGVLSDVKSILPSLTRDEAVHMLQKTATRTSINHFSTVNGAGVLNHYKMLRVAQRLHEAGLADNRQLLYDDSMYDFSSEARQLADEAEQLLTFPDNSTSYTEGFKKLRQSFFLDSDNTATRTQLADIYQKFGHVASAELYHAPIKEVKRSYFDSNKAVIRSIADKLLFRKIDPYDLYRALEIKNFGLWLDTKGTFNAKEIAKAKQELEATVGKTIHALANKALNKKNAIEMLDSHQMLEIIVHNANYDKVSDNTMRLLLEYAGETNPEVLDEPRVITVIKQRAAALKKLANNLGEKGTMLKKILRLLAR